MQLEGCAFIGLICAPTAPAPSFRLIYFCCPLWQPRKYPAFFKLLTPLIKVSDRWFYSLCSLPACVFLSSVLCRLTDVETFRWFLNSCIIYFRWQIYKLPLQIMLWCNFRYLSYGMISMYYLFLRLIITFLFFKSSWPLWYVKRVSIMALSKD